MKKKILLGLGFVGMLASQAQAALTVDPIATTDYMTVAGAVVVALGSLWAVKKGLGLLR